MRPWLAVLLVAVLLRPAGSAYAAYDTEWVEFPALKQFGGEPVQLEALQFRPQSSGPFPALVLMHGCSGMYAPSGHITASYRHWAELLALDGYIALLVDSFNPRGYRTICELQNRPILESRERVEDAYAAARWLSTRPYVEKGKIGLIGWSNGGTGTLYAMRPASRLEPAIRAAVAFYPGCRTLTRAQTPYQPYAPLLILAGGADDWTPAAPCAELVDIAKRGRAPADIVIYPGAHHAFDRINLPVRYRPNVRNLNKPDRLGATVGEHPEAREAAVKRTREFFAQTVKN